MPSASIGIVIPCYRQSHWLGTALQSLREQTDPAEEIVVVDDGSPDETVQVAAEHGVSLLRQTNLGLSQARNTGLRALSTEWVLFLDADDWLTTGALRALRTAAAEGSAMVVMGYRFYGGRGLESDSRVHLPPAQDCFPYLIDRSFGPPHCLLVPRRDILAIGGFCPSLASCEDWDAWIRLALRGLSLRQVPIVGAVYRRYAGSMSTNYSRMLLARSQVLVRLADAALSGAEVIAPHLAHLALALARTRLRLRRHRLDATQIESRLARFRSRSLSIRPRFSDYFCSRRREISRMEIW